MMLFDIVSAAAVGFVSRDFGLDLDLDNIATKAEACFNGNTSLRGRRQRRGTFSRQYA